MSKMDEIESLAVSFAVARSELRGRVEVLESALNRVRRKAMPGIRAAVDAAAAAYDRLHALLADTPELFAKPRTVVIDGIRIGWAKGKGRLDWDDSARVIARIRQYLPEREVELIRLKESLDVAGLAKLPAAELKRIGVRVEDSGDAVVIRPTDGRVDKLVAALLADAEPGEDE